LDVDVNIGRVVIGVALGLLCSSALHAEDATELPVIFADEGVSASGKALLRRHARRIEAWAQDAALTDAVAVQNRRKQTLAKIRKIDAAWTGGGDLESLERKLLDNACANALNSFMEAAGGYKEAFVMDELGALVCMTQRTSDYWQGDEPKWRRSFNEGRGAIYIGAASWDESAQSPLVQISVPIMSAGRAVGALTVGKTVSAQTVSPQAPHSESAGPERTPPAHGNP
jgi:hypothetical protein